MRPHRARGRTGELIGGLVVMAALLSACGRTEEVASTLAPLVPVDSLPSATVAATSTTTPPLEPARPLLTVLPEGDCVLLPALANGEITFVSGDRLDGVAADGTGARCLATLQSDQLGPVQWSPRGERATLRSATLLDEAGTRSSGFSEDNTRLVWEHPLGEGLLGPTASSRTLVRRTVDADRIRTEVTFLARTDLVVSHPGGGLLIGAGMSYGSEEGVFAADEAGQDPIPLVRFEGDGPHVTELGVDADGLSLWFVADAGDRSRLHRVGLVDRVLTDVTTEQEPIQRLTTGPVAGTLAWQVGLCNSTVTTQVLDGRDGSVVTVGTGTQLEGQSVSPVGWLDAGRLVVVARPLGCDGPGDVWIWNPLDGSAALLTTTVEHVATRTVMEAARPLAIDPALPPVEL